MAKVGVITKFPFFAQYFDEMGKYFPDDEIRLYFEGYDGDTVRMLDDAERDGCTALVTGAFTYEDLADHTDLPIVDVEADVQDIINAWTKVKLRGETPKRVAVFLVKSNPILKYTVLEQELSIIFDAQVQIMRFSTRAEYEPLIASLKDSVDLIIAGEMSIDVCRKYEIPNVFLEIGLNNKMSGVEQALAIAHAEIESRARNRRLHEILNLSEEGMLLLDKQGKILEINRAATRLLNLGASVRNEDFTLVDILDRQGLQYTKSDELIPEFDNEILGSEEKGQLIFNSKILKAYDSVEGAIITVRETKDIEEIEKKIRKKITDKGHVAKYDLSSIIGISREIRDAKNLLKRFGKFDGNVLIIGETGTGKELFAQSIHNESKRKNEPFFAVNCAALPPSILESELFGYSEGSFTGAVKGGKPGIFELAHGGTLYLDEITEMDVSCQSKLLRVIQEKEVRRVGDSKVVPIDVRIIAASNRDIWQEVQENRFREDLYYRLNIMMVKAPPLRKRKDDIMVLIDFFIMHYGEKYGTDLDIRFTRRAREYLMDYPWHGNVRELQNFVERLYVYGVSGENVDVQAVSELIHEFKQEDFENKQEQETTIPYRLLYGMPEESSVQEDGLNAGQPETIRNMENKAILDALDAAGGNRSKAAKMLGISRTTLWRRLNGLNN